MECDQSCTRPFSSIYFFGIILHRSNTQTAPYKHDKTTHVVKKPLINDSTFRMPQHTSSEVTVGYNIDLNA